MREVNIFMKKLLGFFLFLFNLILLASCTSTNTDNYVIKGIMPGGAPSVGLSNYIIETNTKDNYTILGQDTSPLQVAFKKSGEVQYDVIVAPLNLGAQLYAKGFSTYKLAAVLTWGNLYFASRRADFTLQSLNGSNVTFFGQNSINMAVVDYVLSGNNITTGERTYLGSTGLTQVELLKDENVNEIYLTAEPALSVAMKQKSDIKTISVQELYSNISGQGSYPQAGLFVSENLINNHKALLDSYLEGVKASCDKMATDLNTSAANASTLLGTPAAVLKTAIPNSNIKYEKAKDVKNKINFVANLKLPLFGDKLPQDELYY